MKEVEYETIIILLSYVVTTRLNYNVLLIDISKKVWRRLALHRINCNSYWSCTQCSVTLPKFRFCFVFHLGKRI